MASSKNVQALNSRLDAAYRSRVEELYRQQASRLAHIEQQKSETAKLLKSVKKRPSDREALSIKFLGPAPKSGHHRPDRPVEVRPSSPPSSAAAEAPAEPASIIEAPMQHRRQLTANPSTVASSSDPAVAVAAVELERAKTFANVEQQQPVATEDASLRRRQRSRSNRRRRARTPLPSKLERFYAQLDDTKHCCGLPVIDASQTAAAREFCLTLSRAEWRVRLAKIDPEYFKNADFHVDSDSESDS
uniref:Uncharacterized protein n=1 Tax=Macrostomum lignano TaxID=282301 RepID=A0A1I8GLW2_9PLAT